MMDLSMVFRQAKMEQYHLLEQGLKQNCLVLYCFKLETAYMIKGMSTINDLVVLLRKA